MNLQDMTKKNISEELICRLLDKNDMPEIYDLMEEIRPPIAGLSSNAIYSAICCDALSIKNVVIVVAKEQEKLIGFNIAIIDLRHYWRSFPQRHLLLAIRIVVYRLLRLIRVGFNVVVPASDQPDLNNKYISSFPSNRSWKDSTSLIAKIVYAGVAKQHRKKGVGEKLMKYLLRSLAKYGVRRVDAYINMANIPSIRLCYKMGYRIERMANGLFASISID